MELFEMLGYAGAVAVGLVLGLMGSGGSIMAVPILSYLFHINPVTTTAYSLFVVGTSASVGSLRFLKQGLIDLRTAGWFALPAVIGVFAVRRFLIPMLPSEFSLNDFLAIDRDRAIMVLFGIVLCLAALTMIRNRGYHDRMPRLAGNPAVLVAMGAGVGLLTGIVGVGGGFLIVPVLVGISGMPMARGVATSLFIIAVNALIGFTGNLGYLEIDWYFLLCFTGLSLAGILMGTFMARRIRGFRLKRGFGWMCLATAGFILCRELVGFGI